MVLATWRISVLALVAAVTVAAARATDHCGASKFTVTGKVLCQDCTKSWNTYAHGAKPIPGSTVGVTCLDSRNARTVYYGKDTTDDEGRFDVEVPYRVDAAEIDPRSCVVRLGSSGKSECAVATDFNGGKTGKRLYSPSHSSPGVVKYTAGPFYFTVPQCELKQNCS